MNMHSGYYSGGPDSGFDYVPLPVGKMLAQRYEILSQPIMGRNKAVYRARDHHHNHDMVIAHYQHDNEPDKLMSLREEDLSRQLQHPGIAPVLASGLADWGGPYLVLPYIEGPTLALIMLEERRLETTRAIEIVSQICLIVSHIHQQGRIHGSLKANHVILDRNGPIPDSVKLIDFSQSCRAGERRFQADSNWADVLQLVGHASPEELKGEAPDCRSDIYSIGCLLFKILTGKAPFSGACADEICRKHLEEPAQALRKVHPQGGFSPALEDCVSRCLGKDPNHRIQSTEEVLNHLRSCKRSSLRS